MEGSPRALGLHTAYYDDDPWLELTLSGAEADWLDEMSVVFEHSLLRPGATEPYGWTWAAGQIVPQDR